MSLGGLSAVGGTAFILGMNGMDFATAYDEAKQRMAPLTKRIPVGGASGPGKALQTNQWRQMIDKPEQPRSWLQQKLSNSRETTTMLTHEKLASIIYKNGHSPQNPIEQMQKMAAPSSPLFGAIDYIAKSPLKAMGLAMGAGVLARQIYDPIEDKYKSQAAYPAMFEKFPELQNANPEKIDDYWNIMREYSPTMTHNPIVAGQFIKNMLDFGMEGIDHPTLQSIVDIEGAKNKAFAKTPLSPADVAKMVV